MDLKRNQITLSQLMADPKAKAVLQRRFGPYLKHPMAKAAGSLTLAQLSEMAAVYLPQKTIQDTIRELGACNILWTALAVLFYSPRT